MEMSHPTKRTLHERAGAKLDQKIGARSCDSECFVEMVTGRLQEIDDVGLLP